MNEPTGLSPADLQVGPGFTEPSTPEGLADLTPREWQVLSRRAATGEGVKAIAHHLGCTQSTVRWHQQCAREKLGMKTTWQLVAWMLRRGHLSFYTQDLPPGLETAGKPSAQVVDLTARRALPGSKGEKGD